MGEAQEMNRPGPQGAGGEVDFDGLLEEVRGILDGSAGEEAIEAVCRLLKQRVGHYDWVGFYRADAAGRTLTLGPYAGAPTEHVEIPFGRGICGQAAERGETFLVQDVSAESNYLSCSVDVRSEVVVPVFRDGRIVAELDIDSHALAPFTPADRAFLERLAELVAPRF